MTLISENINPTFLLPGLAILLLVVLIRRHLLFPTAYLPPGPRGYPIIGNMFEIPRVKPQEVYAEWAKKFGDLIYLKVLGTKIVVLNSQEAAIALLEKKGPIYQNRPKLVFAGEIIGHEKGVGMVQGGPRHREMRRHMNVEIGPHKVQQFASIEEKESNRYLKKLLNDPEEFRDHIRWIVGNTILKIGYGYSVREKNDPFIDIVERVASEFAEYSQPGMWIVDMLPFFKHFPSWFPGLTFHKFAKKYKSTLDKSMDDPYDMVKEQMVSGVAVPSVATRLIDTHPGDSESDVDCIKWTLWTLYLGGADTSVSSISAFFLAMTMYPSVLKRAQGELDTVTLVDSRGNGRLPTISDRERLPYIGALIKEVLRWAVVAPLGFPHCAEEEDIYNGYRIPKGALVIANIWGILNDPRYYPEPKIFNPERFLGPVEKQQPDPRHMMFGYGRRICPGSALAEQTIFIIVTRTLAVFDINANGDSPSGPLMEGMHLEHPVPFKCSIVPRSQHHATLIEQELALP